MGKLSSPKGPFVSSLGRRFRSANFAGEVGNVSEDPPVARRGWDQAQGWREAKEMVWSWAVREWSGQEETT